MLVVAGGALVGATASGLSGFAFAATTLGLYAHFLPAGVVSPLVVAASLSVQLIILPMIWRRLDWRSALPFLAGGVCGVPFGAALLTVLSADTFRHVAGGLLLLFAATALLAGRLPETVEFLADEAAARVLVERVGQAGLKLVYVVYPVTSGVTG